MMKPSPEAAKPRPKPQPILEKKTADGKKEPLWEREWAKIRKDALARFYTGCMTKFKKNTQCKSDPIKDDLILKFGRAVNAGNLKEASLLAYQWTGFQPLISVNTARVYDLALSVLAVAIIKKGTVRERLQGLNAIANLAIMNSDLLHPLQKGSLFQKVVKRYPEIFVDFARIYPSDEVGLFCLNRDDNTFRRYSHVTKKTPGKQGGLRELAAIQGIIHADIHPSLWGPTWGCSSCEMIERDFFCGRGLPACMEESMNLDRPVTARPADGKQVQDWKKQARMERPTRFSKLPKGGSKPSSSSLPVFPGSVVGGLSQAETLQGQCDPFSTMGGAAQGGMGAGFSKAAALCFASSNKTMEWALFACHEEFHRSSPAHSVPAMIQYSLRPPWQTSQDPECMVGQPGGNQTGRECFDDEACRQRHESACEDHPVGCAEARESVTQAKDILDLDGVRNPILGSCTLAGSSACTEAEYDQQVDWWYEILQDGAIGFFDVNSFVENYEENLTFLGYVDTGDEDSWDIVLAGGVDDLDVTVFHEYLHLVLMGMGIPYTENESSPIAGESGGPQHDLMFDLECRYYGASCETPTDSGDSEESCDSSITTCPDDGSEYCLPTDPGDCGCSAVTQEMATLMECTRRALTAEEQAQIEKWDPDAPITYPDPLSGGGTKLPDNVQICLDALLKVTVVPEPEVSPPSVVYCRDEAEPCTCYGCREAFSFQHPRCSLVDCEEGYHCNPATGECESDARETEDPVLPPELN